MVTVSFEDVIEIPAGIENLEEFRKWVRSDDFPQRGRIDYIGGRIEVDTQAQAFYAHGGSLTEIVHVL